MRAMTQFMKGCARTVVLKVLSERSMYGYEIATVLAARSEDVFALGQGTLYPMLYSLEKKGLICPDDSVKQAVGGRKRIYYRLTPKGREALVEDLHSWSEIERGMGLVLRSAHA